MRFMWDEPFRTLVVHFFKRFFDTDTASEDSVPRTRLIQLLALSAVVTFLLMVLLIRGIASAQFGAIDEIGMRISIHFTFVCYAMLVIGLVMTFKWDALFPDRRDYLILAPLPISAKRLFTAKLIALCGFLLLFLVATNLFLLVPVVFMDTGAVLGHIVGVLGGSAFAALFFAGLQGVLINLLTPRAFRRVSPSVQMVAITLLIALLLILPILNAAVRLLILIDSPLLDYFPPVWFLGVYESLSFSPSAVPKAGLWTAIAFKAFGIAGMTAVLSYVVGYRRHARRVMESFESGDVPPSWWAALSRRVLNSWLLMNPAQRAAFYFIGKISDRSAKHRISVALYSGFGLALVLSSLFAFDRREAFPFVLSKSGVLEASAVLSFLLLAGWRATFNVPYELPANWVFQMADRASALEFRKAIRKWVFACRIVPLYALIAFFEFAWFDVATAVSHLVFDLIATAFLTEAFFFGFRKVPFTCAFLKSKLQLVFYAVAYLCAYTTYTTLAGEMKGWVAAEPVHLLRFLGGSAMLFGLLLIYRALARAETSKIIYEEPDPSFQQLNLS